MNPLRGTAGPTDKERADATAIGGLRNSADSVSRRAISAEFRRCLGVKLQELLQADLGTHKEAPESSWVEMTCKAIGAKDDVLQLVRSPVQAITVVRDLIMNLVGTDTYQSSKPKTKVDAPLLEAWRAAACNPDHLVPTWLLDGAPAGILHQLEDHGIFQDCAAPSEQRPEDLHCDDQNFRNYAGVEEHGITATELQEHIDKGHLVEVASYDELAAYVGGEPVLNKIGLILKKRNGVAKERLILDTKERGKEGHF